MNATRAGLLALALPLLLGAAASPQRPAAKNLPRPAVKSIAAATPAAGTVKGGLQESVRFAQGVTMTEMVYRRLPGYRPLTLDLYSSDAKGFPRPGLVFIHGGEWISGDRRYGTGFADLPSVLARLAARGLVVASVDYRLSGEARFPAALQDVKSAIRWLRTHKADFNLDETRIAVWGSEAGGHLAAMAGASCGVALLEPESDSPPEGATDKPASDCVQGVIVWQTISDLENLSADLGKPAPDKSAAGNYLGCEPALCPAGLARNASPLTFITAMSPPFLIQHAAPDAHVAPRQSQRLYDALRAKSVPAELVIYPAGDAADGVPGSQALEKLEAFLDTTFPKKPASSPYNPPKRQGLPY